jgi:putative Holliday junction resolvase
MSFGRRLGIDFGQARIGLAICDLDGLVATPFTTLKNDKSLFIKLGEVIEEYSIVGIYLGKPKHLSGVEGATVELVASFAERFAESFDIPITYVDERLTSGAAEKLLKNAGKNSKESRGLVDQLAAVAILELGIQIEKRN